MSFRTMAKSLVGEIPNTPESLIRAKLNEALGNIYDSTDWSFQTQQGGWYCPGKVADAGSVTVTPYSPFIIGDATATAAWAAITTRPLLTELQFRDPDYALYNIIAVDPNTNAPFITLELDRPWMEPTSGAGRPYMIYQAYFPAPVADFRKFNEIRDTTLNAAVSFTELSQDDLAMIDPQRLMFGPCSPTYAVPWGTDQRRGSSTFGHVMYELWPHVLSLMPYSFSYKRRGPQLVNAADNVPYPLTEELVMWRTKEVLYQFKEAQKGEQVLRGSGADYRFLAQAAGAEYQAILKRVRSADANLHRDFVNRPRNSGGSSDGYSTNRSGRLNIGTFGR